MEALVEEEEKRTVLTVDALVEAAALGERLQREEHVALIVIDHKRREQLRGTCDHEDGAQQCEWRPAEAAHRGPPGRRFTT